MNTHKETIATALGEVETPMARLQRQRDAYRDALERVAVECETEAMGCDCGPAGSGEACPRCEIRYVTRTTLARRTPTDSEKAENQ